MLQVAVHGDNDAGLGAGRSETARPAADIGAERWAFSRHPSGRTMPLPGAGARGSWP